MSYDSWWDEVFDRAPSVPRRKWRAPLTLLVALIVLGSLFVGGMYIFP